MADNFLNYTGLQYYHNRAKTVFASQADLNALDDKVDDIISEGGEPNVIEVVQQNGAPLPVENKAVNVTVPEKLSELTNDGDGSTGSAFATEAYVDQNGGKIDVIKVNGTAQKITNKAVDITVPTKVSDIDNDSGFQTQSQVQTAIDNALTSAMVYKGSVSTYADLPASGNKVGDFYNVLADGKNYAWDGTAWDDAGGTIDTSTLWSKAELTAVTTAQIDALFA